ncbi:hypothetical protein SATMO3_00880 [Sporomusa aerivorans]
MADNLNANLERLLLLQLGGAANSIAQALAAEQAARLGQSAVVSTKVHAFDSHNPEHVQILVDTDAGKIFYHRSDCGAVCHLDIFHECGEIDHKLAASYICRAVALYNTQAAQQADGFCQGIVNPELIDIQTATGGGRITGSLRSGQKPSVRRVHENHVHVALSLPTADFACLLYIVAAVETAIQNMGLEPRRNERISYVESAGGQNDLSPYTDQTDSFLKDAPASQEGSKPAGAASDNWQAQEPDRHSVGQSAPSENSKGKGGGQTLIGVDQCHSGEMFTGCRSDKTISQASAADICLYAPRLFESWQQAITRINNKSKVTAASSLSRRLQENGLKAAGACIYSLSELDVAATVSAAAARFLTEDMTGRLRIHPLDIRFIARRPKRGCDTCFVVDSSGSMAGRRLQAAQYLAGEICRYGYGRVSLVHFQDSRAELLQPFTYSRQAVLSAFNNLTPAGATPLALGLKQSLAYIIGQQTKHPLIVLLTDGIPGRKYGENADPMSEALFAAAEIDQAGCGFLCIGLDDEDVFLQKLAYTAGGVAYIFSEFTAQVMQ